MSRTHSTEHQTCGACGSTFPASYWHECPGDQIEERVALRIASWIESVSHGPSGHAAHGRALAAEIRAGKWRLP